MTMTHRERFVRTLTGMPVDRVPFIKLFGGTNAMLPHWEAEHPGLRGSIDQILQFEGPYRGWQTTPVNFWMSQRGESVVLEETDRWVVVRHGDGTVQRSLKHGDYHVQTLEWPVKNRVDWERVKDKHLQADDPSRFPADWAGHVAEYRDRDYPLQLTHGGVYGFARTMMGDERLLYTLFDDPELVHDIMETYTDLQLALWRRMVAEVEFDLVEFWEDMASRNGSLISPAAFRRFMGPCYLRVAEFARRHGIQVILVDSDGYTDDLAGVMIEHGVTALYPFEVGAGCSVEEGRRRYPSLGILGGLAKECMIGGRETIAAELTKVRRYVELGRYIPGPDHFVLESVSFANYRYFMARLREIVMTTGPMPGAEG